MADRLPLYDTHAHFYTADAAAYPIDPTGAREGEAALVHRIMTDPGTPERVFALWDAAGVAAGAAVQYNTAYKTDNRYAIRIAQEHPGRLGTVVILKAGDPATPAALAGMAAAGGVTGLRLVGFSDEAGRFEFLEGAAALATWAAAERLGLVIVLMIRLKPDESPEPALRRVADLAAAFPAARIVIDHAGWPGAMPESDAAGLTPAHRALAEARTVSLKITSLNFARFEREGIAADRFVRAAADLYGAGRLMWGSDFGNTLTDYALLADKARRSAALLGEAERRAYLHYSGAALFAQKAD
ncbi:MAG: amidohydrolase family protein [Sphingomonas fennica]